jgi:hypothetical protein
MIDPSRFQALLNAFDLKRLFNELGWDRADLGPQQIEVQGQAFTLTPIAQKRGVALLRCSPDADGRIPLRAVQQRIEREAAKLAHEHLLVFADAAETTLTWLWVLRVPGQPAVTRFHTWHKGTNAEALRQRLDNIVWSLEQEEAITLTHVIDGLRRAFDRDRITKRFYDRFKAEHQAFAGFVTGLDDIADKAWYASLMLNRLMFVYFIQKKGFLDGNPDYLAHRLREVQAQSGSGHFHSFYRLFLRRLFHEGLGLPKDQRKPGLEDLIGDVPYLNGGLFALHELEDKYPDIEIDDAAFERLFEFFDAYQWHLDDRPLKDSNEINPDVLGYIFEKYINQKQMGAYYTKEDITGYISQNTVIPFLLDQARTRCKVAFEGEASVWTKLAEHPDAYLYDAVRTGVIDANGDIVPESALPDFVQTGMHDPKARMFERRYNLGEAVFQTATGERGTLPTETWREYVDRRRRCLDLRERMKRGEINSIEDLITYNLDIRQFMQDVIQDCDSPALLRAIWQTIVGRAPEASNQRVRHGITVLDPTCGSGAFLFAALNVLEPLYEACLERMQGFIDDADRLADGSAGRGSARQYPDFRAVLDEVGRHPSSSYFTYKSIILHNLYGVDIMPEAVEICKLRLFLKLVSQVERGQELEPLPDMDFNIRAGNTLVGFATEAQFDRAKNLASDVARHDAIKLDLAELAEHFDTFRKEQTVYGATVSAADKARLRSKLHEIADELDRFLAQEYGINPDTPAQFDTWCASHQPFHWFAEFYGIMREGGFDVVIGNPPYLETSQIRYIPNNLVTLESKAVHSMCIERSLSVLAPNGGISMILPMALTSTQRMQVTQNLIEAQRTTYYLNYGWRPSKLFDTVNRALSIFVARPGDDSSSLRLACTGYQKWTAADRDHLFGRIFLTPVTEDVRHYWKPKISHLIESDILGKLMRLNRRVERYWLQCSKGAKGRVYYRTTGGLYWKVFTNFPPEFFVNGVPGHSTRETSFCTGTHDIAYALCAVLSSNLFWWWYTLTSNLRDLNPSDIRNFPVPDLEAAAGQLVSLGRAYIEDLKANSTMLTRQQRTTGITQTQSFRVAASKELIDLIDRELANLIGLSIRELDFIINYDIKYRMSSLGEDEG